MGFAEYFKAPAYCRRSETAARLKAPVAASSFSPIRFRGEAQVPRNHSHDGNP